MTKERQERFTLFPKRIALSLTKNKHFALKNQRANSQPWKEYMLNINEKRFPNIFRSQTNAIKDNFELTTYCTAGAYCLIFVWNIIWSMNITNSVLIKLTKSRNDLHICKHWAMVANILAKWGYFYFDSWANFGKFQTVVDTWLKLYIKWGMEYMQYYSIRVKS